MNNKKGRKAQTKSTKSNLNTSSPVGETIRLVVARPGERAEVHEIEHVADRATPALLGAVQALVGGHVEQMPFTFANCFVFADEEGLLKGLAPNREGPHGMVLVGPMVLAKRGKSGGFSSLSDGEVEAIIDNLEMLRVA
jgi:hypothetical protein